MGQVRHVSATHDVTVIGCGLMGSAIVRQLAASGHAVVAWNRTTERAQTLAGGGVTPVASVAEAVRRSPLVLTCTLDYASTLSALSPVADWTGKTLVNLAVGTPSQATEMAGWAAGRGVDYLDGIPVCFPRDIGGAATMVLYSGSAAVWRRHAETLGCLGGASRHVSEDVAATNVLETGLGSFFMTAQRAYVEAVNYLQDQSVSPQAMRMLTTHLVEILLTTTAETVDAVEAGERQDAHADQATIAMMADGVRTNLTEMRAAGHDAPVLTAAVQDLEALVEAGLGHHGIHARRPAVDAG
jgi:3-hydroxyisobutyrate dehydrogenase-like beta-hydroxyacid dehydrogenase